MIGNADHDPIRSWRAYYCTLSYHHSGGNGSGNYPSAWWTGFNTQESTGLLFDHCVFLANGTPYVVHESSCTPDNTTPFCINYANANDGARLWTMRDCEWRAKNLPNGIATSNIQAVRHAGKNTSTSVELDGVTIGAAFADQPFDMGGMTVRYHNVVHERTGSSKPWTGAGAEVAF